MITRNGIYWCIDENKNNVYSYHYQIDSSSKDTKEKEGELLTGLLSQVLPPVMSCAAGQEVQEKVDHLNQAGSQGDQAVGGSRVQVLS